ncbi:9682_t:CDS:1 [Acaulospora morrowiae]|uniref:9682_t:CDS:1 n=1 Tax=Acaulospora morrowiae TaxID=94023 RepID=A0A9N9CGA1_9GLOM|nr:9682_t:CDS:1 [Acaulospora morrowiae]
MLKNLLLITVLFTALASAYPSALLPGPWIVSKVAGKSFELGQTINLEILCPPSVNHLESVNLLQRGSTYNITLLKNVKLHSGSNKLKLKLPVGGDFAKPSPQNYIAIYLAGRRMDYSATFRIGKPDFGITFIKPCAGEVLHPGDTFLARWKGKLGDGFTFAWGLLEPTTDFTITPFFFLPDAMDFKKGEFTFTLPADIPKGALWKFGCRANGTTDSNPVELFSAGTFLIA